MKKLSGFSVLEFILFVLIVGILIFLTIPFLRPLYFSSALDDNIESKTFEHKHDSNNSPLIGNDLDFNHSNHSE